LKIENEPVMEAGFQCAGCGEWNQTTVDESAGAASLISRTARFAASPMFLISDSIQPNRNL
jgi:hypothetical protein